MDSTTQTDIMAALAKTRIITDDKLEECRKRARSAISTALAEVKRHYLEQIAALAKNECDAYCHEADYVALRLSETGKYQDFGKAFFERFARGLEVDNEKWYNEHTLKYRRARKVLLAALTAADLYEDVLLAHLSKNVDLEERKLIDKFFEARNGEINELHEEASRAQALFSRSLEVSAASQADVASGANMPARWFFGEMAFEDGLCPDGGLPLCIPDGTLPMFAYQYASQSENRIGLESCKGAASNLVAQMLHRMLPSAKVLVYDGNSLLSDFAGVVRQLESNGQDGGKPVFQRYERTEENAFFKELSEAADAGLIPTDPLIPSRSVIAVFLVGEDTDKKLLETEKVLLQEAVSRGRNRLRVIIAGESGDLDAMGNWDGRLVSVARFDFLSDGRVQVLTEYGRVSGRAQVADWLDIDPARRGLAQVLKPLARPNERPTYCAATLAFGRCRGINGELVPHSVLMDKNRRGIVFLEGAPGSGKSFALENALVTAMEKYDPEALQFFLIDLKGGATFKTFAGIPHVRYALSVCGSDDADIVRAFLELVSGKLKERMGFFSAVSAKDLEEFNSLPEERRVLPSGTQLPKLARLIVVVDECSSLFDENANQKEGNKRLSSLLSETLRMGRAYGVHIVFTSQKKQDLPSGWHDFFDHYFLLRQEGGSPVPYQMRHYGSVRDALEDHDEFRRGEPLVPWPGDDGAKNRLDERLGKLRRRKDKNAGVCLDAGRFQTLDGFPSFDNKLKALLGKSVGNGGNSVVVAVGVQLQSLDSLAGLSFDMRNPIPNLLIVGRAERHVEMENALFGCGESKWLPRDAFANLLILSLQRNPVPVQVDVIDPDGRWTDLPALKSSHYGKTRYCVEEKACEQAIRAWAAYASGREQNDGLFHFLVVADPQRVKMLREESIRENSSSSADNGGSGARNWKERHQRSANVESAGKTSNEPAVSPAEVWKTLFSEALLHGPENRSFLVLATDDPGRVETSFLSFHKGFSFSSSFRIAHFDYGGMQLSRLPKSFPNRSQVCGNLFETGEFENNTLETRILPFEPFALSEIRGIQE